MQDSGDAAMGLSELEAMGPAGVEVALVWLEEHAPDTVADLRLLGSRMFGGDTPHVFIMAAYKRERRARGLA
jgi:hypothetical protein